MVHKREHARSGDGADAGAILREVPCLSRLAPTALAALQEKVREQWYRRGDILFREGTVCKEVLVLIEGSVKVYRLSEDGRQRTLWVLGAGDCFCLAPFYQRAQYPATGQCLTDVRVLSLQRPEHLSLLEATPGVAPVVVGCFCRRMAEMVRVLAASSRRPVPGRLARLLLELADGRGVATAEGVLLDCALTHEELAAFIGTAREVVSRTLERWERDGLVRIGRGRLVLLDRPRLEEILAPRRPPKDNKNTPS
jgi:CRP/FNR family transcriptional regulator